MPTSNPGSICLFCYKPATHSTGNLKRDGSCENQIDTNLLINKFITLLDRYIDNGERPTTSDFEWSKHLSCCQECKPLIRECCADYHQLKLLELQLEWKLERLAASMSLAGRVPSRWAKLQKLFETQANHMTEDAYQNCLSTVRRFRQNILRKCSRHPSRKQPRVLLKKIAEHLQTPVQQDLAPNLDEFSSDHLQVKVPEIPRASASSATASRLPPIESESQLKKSKPKTVTTRLIVVKFESPDVEQGSPEVPSCSEWKNFRETGSPVHVKSEVMADSIDSFSDNDAVTNSDNDEDTMLSTSDNNETIGAVINGETKEITNISQDTESDNIFDCPKCDKSFATPRRVTRHLRQVHAEGSHNCPECNKIFKSQELLKRHSMTHSGETRSRYKCLDCYRTFERRSTLVQHQGRAHKKGIPIPCKICDGIYFTKQDLDKHVRVVHAERAHKCKQCGSGFKARSKLNEHMVNVHNDNRFKCDKCGTIVKSKRAMKKHAALHKKLP